jgi:hypothetical protein
MCPDERSGASNDLRHTRRATVLQDQYFIISLLLNLTCHHNLNFRGVRDVSSLTQSHAAAIRFALDISSLQNIHAKFDICTISCNSVMSIHQGLKNVQAKGYHSCWVFYVKQFFMDNV